MWSESGQLFIGTLVEELNCSFLKRDVEHELYEVAMKFTLRSGQAFFLLIMVNSPKNGTTVRFKRITVKMQFSSIMKIC